MTTAEPAHQQRLLHVQALDTRARQLAHQRRILPEIAELAEVGQRLRGLAGDQVRARTEVADLERAVRRAEADVELVRTRAARDTQRLNSGTVSHKDLIGLQHELESLVRRQSDLEDAELEVMEQLETATAHAERLAEQHARAVRDEAELTARRDAALAGIADQEATLAAERAAEADGLDVALLALYDRIRDQTGGVAAAELTGSRCGGCRVELSAYALAELKSLAPEQVAQCEECRCILVRDFTEAAASAATT